MNTFDSDIKKYAQKTRLKASEKAALRERIVSYMEYHPLPGSSVVREKAPEKNIGIIEPAVSIHSFITVPFGSLPVRIFGGVLAVIVFVVVPVVAERSVPGDVLYLVKTEVNEGIRTQFANSPYEKVVLETKLMERRIAEARLLANEGKLTEEVEGQIAETVKTHAEAVQSGIAELEEENAEDAAIAKIAFTSALEVQSAVLDQAVETGTSSVATIIDVVNVVHEAVSADENVTEPSFEALSARIELETTRAYELFETVKETATTEEIEDIERRLSDINRKVNAAKDSEDEDLVASTESMKEALGLIQKLVTFMTDIDLRESVALETIVPIELTVEERVAAVTKILTDVRTGITELREGLPQVTDADVAAKIASGTDEAAGYAVKTEEALTNELIAEAEAQAAIAHAFVTDLRALMSPFVTPADTVPGEGLPDPGVGTTTEVLPGDPLATSTEMETGTTTDTVTLPVEPVTPVEI